MIKPFIFPHYVAMFAYNQELAHGSGYDSVATYIWPPNM